MVSDQDLKYQRAIAVSDMFQILALSLRLPHRKIVKGLLDGTYVEDVVTIFRELDFESNSVAIIQKLLSMARASDSREQELLSKLRQEYTRLFTHPRNPVIPIYEALFRYEPDSGKSPPPLLISPAAFDATRCYKEAGLKLSGEFNDSSDHMATELEFMMYLYQRKARAIDSNDNEELIQRTNQINEFNTMHLNKWGSDFFERCKLVSTNDFYRAVGEAGNLFLTNLPAHDEDLKV